FDPKLHRLLYAEHDPSRLVPAATAALTEPAWSGWRKAMNAAIQGATRRVTPATGDIRLQARDAAVHGTKLRYEPPSNKNVLGFWTEPQDWAAWEFEVEQGGSYEV
ncbi:MAG: hypothetical protein ACK53L_30625, partial [Pirellulaceae bacterium]